MDDGGGEVSERARRRREEGGESGGLSVADLLARHGSGRSRQAGSHRLHGDWEDGDGTDSDAEPEVDTDDAGDDAAQSSDNPRSPGPAPPRDSAPTSGANGASRRRASGPSDGSTPSGNRPGGSGDPDQAMPSLAGPTVRPPGAPTRNDTGARSSGRNVLREPRSPQGQRGAGAPGPPSARAGADPLARPRDNASPRDNTRPPAANGASSRSPGAGRSGEDHPGGDRSDDRRRGNTAPPVNGARRRGDTTGAFRAAPPHRPNSPDRPDRPNSPDYGSWSRPDSATESGNRNFGAPSGFTSSEFTGLASAAGIAAGPADGRRQSGPGDRRPRRPLDDAPRYGDSEPDHATPDEEPAGSQHPLTDGGPASIADATGGFSARPGIAVANVYPISTEDSAQDTYFDQAASGSDPAAPDHTAPDHTAPDHAAPDHAAPDHADRAAGSGAPSDVAPEDRTELLFGREELSDATVLLTRLERLGLPAVAATKRSADGPEGLEAPPRSAQRTGSWFSPRLGETVPAPADPFTDTTVLPPDSSGEAAQSSASTATRTGGSRDSDETTIIERPDLGSRTGRNNPPPDRQGFSGADERGRQYAAEHTGFGGYTAAADDDYHHDDYYDDRDDDARHDDYRDDDDGAYHAGAPNDRARTTPDRTQDDDDPDDEDSLPQLTSFGIRDNSDSTTTAHDTDKTGADAGRAATVASDPEQPDTSADSNEDEDKDKEAAAARDAIAARTAKIDETLSRLTAIHAGLGDELADRVGKGDRTRSAKKASRSAQGKASRAGAKDAGPAKTAQTAQRPDDTTGTARASRASSTDRSARAGRTTDRNDTASQEDRAKTGPRTLLGRIFRNRGSRMTVIVLIAALVLTPAFGFGVSWWLNGKLRAVDALDGTGAGVIQAAGQAGDQNYLVVAAGDDALAQTIVLAHLPAKADRAVLLSAPANLVVDRPGCERYDATNRRYTGDTVPAESAEPLGNAFEEGGPRCLVATLQRMTGMPINHFVQLDPAGITPMVDAVDGVPMCVSDRVEDATLGAIVPTPGQQMMNGEQAKAYATAREVRGEPTDGSGLRLRQQRVLSALLTKASALSPFLHLPSVASLAGALGSNSYVDGTDLGQLAELGDALATINQSNVDYARMPTAAEPDTQGNLVPDPTATAQLFAALRGDRPLDGGSGSGSSIDGESSGLPPSAVTLRVLNGSSRAGVAGRAADSLRGVGFTVTSVRDSRHQDGGASVIRASADQASGSATLARAVPGATVQTVPGTGVLELVLGDSFDGQVQAAASSTPAGPPLVTAAQLACH